MHLSPPVLHVRELPEFVSLMALDRSNWPRCLWHGLLPALSGAGERAPWASSVGQLACCDLERRLGAHPVDAAAFWTPLWRCLMLLIFGRMVVGRTSLSLVGFEVAGAGVYVPAPELAFEGAVWGVAEEYGDARLEHLHVLFMPVPGPPLTVQRAEFQGAIIALQSCLPCHLGIDNSMLLGQLAKLLDHGWLVKFLP